MKKERGISYPFWRMSVSYPQNLKTTFKKFEQFMKFCSFFQIVFSFFFILLKADWGGLPVSIP